MKAFQNGCFFFFPYSLFVFNLKLDEAKKVGFLKMSLKTKAVLQSMH